ncbi:unnamed protein product (macronuclear) [Paramecium tetraurelia]|uniref:Uncharacterized protein n=1 Tax=Paramecium tetraurelia TaxID=5888 RepID=A0BUB0_PARTE|nr:uncharacterized protein GSPATT00032359001 [Paramecium tetraurelia]CAK62127.1 unnamed protein product [Paramecium tetraurelia]|eukprot:XP_001429525.1 hypothetical protein (macronuclear) [Paramecium tetraurelia strain d4-2]
MILSERNKPSILLQRKYKPISLSQVLKKPLIVKSLPPIYVSPQQRTSQKKEQKLENSFSQRPPQPQIFNKFEGIGAVGLSLNPIQKQPFYQQYVLMSSKKLAIQVSKKYNIHNKINIYNLQNYSQKYYTESQADKANKWSQTTFDEEQLLEYLNN